MRRPHVQPIRCRIKDFLLSLVKADLAAPGLLRGTGPNQRLRLGFDGWSLSLRRQQEERSVPLQHTTIECNDFVLGSVRSRLPTSWWPREEATNAEAGGPSKE